MQRFLLIFILLFFSTKLIHAQSAGDFQTRQDGNWNSSDTWEEFDGSTWVNTANFPTSANGAIAITHDVIVTVDVSTDQTTIESTGSVTINNGFALTVAAGSGTDLTINGTLTNNGTLTIFYDGPPPPISFATVQVNGIIENSGAINNAANTRLFFGANSEYYHTFTSLAGDIPLANWNAGSTVNIIGYTTNSTAPNNLNQAFGNFIWNTPDQDLEAFIDLGGALTSVAGSFEIINAPGYVSLTQSASLSLVVGGNFLVSTNFAFSDAADVTVNVGGDFEISDGFNFLTGDGDVVLDIMGDFTISGGTQDLSYGIGTMVVNLSGDCNLTGGTITETTSADQTIFFEGSSPQFFTDGATISTDLNFYVNSSSILDLGTNALSGSGALTLVDNSTLRLGSIHEGGAIQETPSTNGNIILPTRNFEAGAELVYNGSATQRLGDGYPDDLDLTIDNPTEVILDQNLVITSIQTLSLLDGVLDLDNTTTTITGSVIQTDGALRGSPAATLIVDAPDGISFGLAGSTDDDFSLSTFTLANGIGLSNVTLLSDLIVEDFFNHNDGNLDFSGQDLTISGEYNHVSGNFISDNTSTLLINGPSSASFDGEINFAGSSALNTFTLNRSGSSVTLGSIVTIDELFLNNGTLVNDGTITMAPDGTITRTHLGSLTNNNVIATTDEMFNVVYNNSGTIQTGPELPTDPDYLDNLTLSGSGDVEMDDDVQINGDLTITNGELVGLTGSSINLGGNFVNSGIATLTETPVSFVGTTDVSGTGTFTFGNMTVASGSTFTQSSGTINVSGDIDNDAGTFTSNSNIVFNGTTSILGDPITLSNFTISNTLNAPSGNLFINGVMTNNGAFNAGTGQNPTVVFNGTNSIAGTNNPTFNNIRISASGILTSPETLVLIRNFINNGDFIPDGNTVEFNGSTTQTIGGSATTDFYNITVNNTTGPPAVRVNGSANLFGILTLNGSTTEFDADGNTDNGVFTVISASSGDGGIATIPSGASVTGNVTVQRFIPSGGRTWRFLASSVTNARVADWQDDFPIIGDFDGASGSAAGPSMYRYVEANGGTSGDRWEEYPLTGSTNQDPLTPGEGYNAFMNNGGNVNTELRGPINQGDVTVPITLSGTTSDDGFNLLGNPYPSVVSWESLEARHNATPGSISTAFAIRNNAEGNVAVYDANGDMSINDGHAEIAMGQSFWMVCLTAPGMDFVFTESDKVIDPATYIRTGKAPALYITMNGATLSDEIALVIAEEATDGYEANLDFVKLDNANFNISTLSSDSLRLAINRLGEVTCPKSVFLDIWNAENGNYNLTFNGRDVFTQEPLTLIDHFTGEQYDVSDDLVVEFTISTSDSSTFGSERFEMIIDKSFNTELALNSAGSCNESTGSIEIVGTEENVIYSVLDPDMNELFSESGTGGNLVYEVPLEYNDVELTVFGQLTGCEENLFIGKETVMGNSVDPEITLADDYVLQSNYETGNQWYLDGVLLESENGQELEVTEDGEYTLEVSIEGCAASTSRTMIITGLEDLSEIEFYPMPVAADLNISVDQNFELNLTESRFVLLAINGKLIENYDVNILDPKHATLDVSKLMDGIYFVIIEDGSQSIKRKIIKGNR